jgi:type II secretory pathway component GspD/PulD (secretin)
MKSLSFATLLMAATLATAQTQRIASFAIVFSGTDVSKALKAVSLRTGTGIVYAAGKDKIPVSLDVTVGSPEEAVRCVASAAGLGYRKVGSLFVVAAPAAMRQALEPYATRVTLTPESRNADELAPKLQDLLPHATVRAAGGRISILGIAEDVALATEIFKDLDKRQVEEAAITDVVVLKRAPAAQIAPLITGLFPTVKVTPTPGDKGGAIALAGPATQIQAARDTIEKLDVSMGSEEAAYRVYNLKYASAPEVVDFLKQAAPKIEAYMGPEPYNPARAGFNPITASMSSGGSYFGGASGGSGGGTGNGASVGTGSSGAAGATGATGTTAKPGDRAKTIVLKGLAPDLDAAFKLLAEVDRKPRQIMVEVNVLETSPENNEAIGLKYNWSSLDFRELPKGSGPSDSTTRPVGMGLFSRVPWNFQAVLSAMVTRKEAKVLARPSIQVVDNGQASFFVGDTIRARIVTGGALGSQNVDIREFPVGIILLIAPRVNADGNITMHVNPVVSTVNSVDGDNIPQTSSREAETTAIVKSGETVVLGGLIRDEDSKVIEEVPFLSKLPIVGQLFRNRTRNHRRSDIIVSITPHLIEDEPATEAKP